jgi:hypothetical protein
MISLHKTLAMVVLWRWFYSDNHQPQPLLDYGNGVGSISTSGDDEQTPLQDSGHDASILASGDDDTLFS